MYTTGNHYMLRTPIYSISLYETIFSEREQNLEMIQFLEEKSFQEALTVSTHDLIPLIKKYTAEKKKLPDNVLHSLIKYIIRSSTRTTPYGLFSGISIGVFSTKTNLKRGSMISCIKRARVDMGWVCGFIKKIENDSQVINVSVKPSARIFFKRR